ncbi:MAG: ABC transporter permease subunit [Chloroflexi bacterium]|nr:ABC transporter permease subunit [Chloroflexota bacterium]
MPWPVHTDGQFRIPDLFVGVWVALLIAIGAVAMTVRRTRQNRERETGQPQFANRWAFGIFAVGALVTFVILGLPVSIDRPYIEGTRYLEGMVIRPEFAALTIGLTLYTGAFNAEIVRGSIQALPTGQTEAANAIGLSGYQRLTLVILPQALRISIPPMVGQAISIWKDTTLVTVILPLRELKGNADSAIAQFEFTPDRIEAYVFVAVIFWIVAFAMSRISQRVERAQGVGER